MADKFFKVDANAVLTLGRNSIKDHTTAVVELIKNAYDADADAVELVIVGKRGSSNSIRVADNGHGMSGKDIEDYWLRIGYSEKVRNKMSPQYGRRKTGEKGIGRLSADRLGAVLELKTKRRAHAATGLLVDWSLFEKSGQEVGQVKLPPIEDPRPKVPKRRDSASTGIGTELIVRKLRQRWTSDDVAKLRSELSLLLPPYPELSKSFSLQLTNDIDPHFNGPIRYGKRAQGEIEFSAKVDVDGALHYRLSHYDQADRSKRQQVSRKVPWSELAPDLGKDSMPLECKLGTIEIRLSYFVRRVDLLSGTGLKLGELRDYLDRNAGVKIYRDNVRVKPYGDASSPDGDWLGLGERKISDPAGARRSTFKIAPSQLVGAVFAGRDISPELVDSSSREGLLDNDAFRQLKVVLMRCINLIESKYHEISKDRPKPGSKASKAKAAVKSLTGNLSSLTLELAELQEKVSGDLSSDVAAVNEQIQLFIEQAESATRDIEEIANQNTVFRGLATVGIASAIFGHETALAVSQADGKVRVAQSVLKKAPPDVARAEQRLGEALQYMEKVASWGKFALGRVNKDKRQRRRVSVTSLVNGVLDELQGPMGASDVEIKRAVALGIEAKTFPMDVEVVLINYLTNAYHEVKRHQRDRIIRVRLIDKKHGKRDGFELSVADNGSGIPPEHAETIWEPLFSTKTDERGKAMGTGLGLAIVKSAVEELAGEVAATSNGPLGGAVFTAWFPKE
jgi:signal transduction histidine kinase